MCVYICAFACMCVIKDRQAFNLGLFTRVRLVCALSVYVCIYVCTCMYVCVIEAFNLGLFTRVRLVCALSACVVHLHVCTIV